MLFGYCGVYSGCFLFKLSMDDVCWCLAFAWGCCRVVWLLGFNAGARLLIVWLVL